MDRRRHPPPPTRFGPAPAQAKPSHAAPPRVVVQKMDEGYSLRSRTKKAATTVRGVPPGYVSLSYFNKNENKYGKWPVKGRGVNEDDIYVKIYNNRVFLWWAYPHSQIDDFIYTGKSSEDISDCNFEGGSKSGYTWHHTGYPHEEATGTMQLVPTWEHQALPHTGGAYLANNS
ncbi:HNH endonuclease [Arenibaculum sp.]|uniref:HNH endonuclease n=1 Tax=Arenibaculum sp. TaxID=2865862 RepID=UPI002E134FEC|nr:HNH endonuclease [Arenibaculum sp.]